VDAVAGESRREHTAVAATTSQRRRLALADEGAGAAGGRPGSTRPPARSVSAGGRCQGLRDVMINRLLARRSSSRGRQAIETPRRQIPACPHRRPDTALVDQPGSRALPARGRVTERSAPLAEQLGVEGTPHDVVPAPADADRSGGQPRPARGAGPHRRTGVTPAAHPIPGFRGATVRACATAPTTARSNPDHAGQRTAQTPAMSAPCLPERQHRHTRYAHPDHGRPNHDHSHPRRQPTSATPRFPTESS
jgi:hypothetical protein